MIALDTNVLVRVVTADDAEQLQKALAILQSGDVWLCKTVILETEWVLRYTYRLSRETIAEVFHKFLRYRGMRVEDRETVSRALSWYDQGMDFADALHLASSLEAQRFATFDRQLARLAEGMGGPQVELLSGGS